MDAEKVLCILLISMSTGLLASSLMLLIMTWI